MTATHRSIAFAFFVLGLVPGHAQRTPAARTRPATDAVATSLPRMTGDIAPSRGIGPFDAAQAQEWRAAAEALSAQSRYDEAEKLYSKLLEEREHALGLNSPELAVDLDNLGRVCFAQMKVQQAAAYYERELQIMETAHGRNDVSTAQPLEELARVHLAAGAWPQAAASIQRALGARGDKTETQAVAEDLILAAGISVSEQMLPAAAEQFERAIRIIEANQGRMSQALLPALDGVAPVFQQTMRSAEAEAALRRALAIRESAFGPVTLEAAGSLDKLGRFYLDQKKSADAGYCYERALFIRTKILGDANPATESTLADLVRVYGVQGRHAEAEPLYRQMLAGKELDTVLSNNALAAVVAARGGNAEAENLFKISIAILDKKGFVSARKPVLNAADLPPELLAETLDQYTALLKKIKRKVDAARMEVRATVLHSAYRTLADNRAKRSAAR
jgi:tetratricopeptide (TPR) repeat protein